VANLPMLDNWAVLYEYTVPVRIYCESRPTHSSEMTRTFNLNTRSHLATELN